MQSTDFQIKLPKRAPESLVKKTKNAIVKIAEGSVQFRKTNRYGYKTLSLGGANRLVMIGQTIVVFNSHRDYETFINNPARS